MPLHADNPLCPAVAIRLRPLISEDSAAVLEPDAPPECTTVRDSASLALERPFYDTKSFKFDRVLGVNSTQVMACRR